MPGRSANDAQADPRVAPRSQHVLRRLREASRRCPSLPPAAQPASTPERSSPRRRSRRPSGPGRDSTPPSRTLARGSWASPPTSCGTTSAPKQPDCALLERAATLASTVGDDDPDARLDAKFAAQALARALQQMTADERDIVLFYAWADLTYADIARALGVPIGTVRSRLNRTRRRLRELGSVVDAIGGDEW